MARAAAVSAAIPTGKECVRCKARWWQEKGHLCRMCYRADQVTDPIAVALTCVRKFIGRRYVEAQFLDGAKRTEVFRITKEADNALDLIAEQLRTRDR